MYDNNFYRFCRLNDKTFDSLKNGYLYFSPLDKLNDPMEGFFNLRFKLNYSDWESLFRDFYSSVVDKRNTDTIDIDRVSNIIRTIENKDISEWQLVYILCIVYDTLKSPRYDMDYIKAILNILNSGDYKNFLKNRAEIRNLAHYERHYDKIAKYIRGIKRNIVDEKLICSFSVNTKEKKAYDNVLMWSHYADGHRGICLEFEFDKSKIKMPDNKQFEFDKSKIKTLDNKQYVDIKKVQYMDSVGTLHFKINTLQIVSNKLCFIVTNTQDIGITKLKDWEYESEYRALVSADHCYGKCIKYDSSQLKSIAFGMRTLNDDKEKIKRLFGNSIKYYQVINNQGKLERIEL